MLVKSCPCPDRHAPWMVCGYPMPCPHHTPECARKLKVLVVVEKKNLTEKVRVSRSRYRRVRRRA